MRKLARRLAISMATATVAVVALASPAHAATNPYSAALACNNDFGGTWANTTDGHRSINASDGTKVGDVYLMYNSATGYNCVATIKQVEIGSATGMKAGIRVEGGSWVERSGNFKYYETIQRSAVDKCVMYSGDILYFTSWEGSSRSTWGNCG
ncbi:hypothetical protein [Rugosimonospora africana]|uniref:Spore-associated protein A n=1 Tax=Rugosimonospora africana TaxID=556532 RepID=A0A8J3R2M9_9ACTN|nr:hypothetical protein [Rugosimonospora africana]GIH20543.1 hypothetical protein Raf01_87150 [Rugosimonospora africana]